MRWPQLALCSAYASNDAAGDTGISAAANTGNDSPDDATRKIGSTVREPRFQRRNKAISRAYQGNAYSAYGPSDNRNADAGRNRSQECPKTTRKRKTTNLKRLKNF